MHNRDEGRLMQTAVDRFGRVLIPKNVRDHLGLRPGTVVTIEEHDSEVLIKASVETSPLECREGALVFTGKAIGDLEGAVVLSRRERLEKFK